MPNGVPEGFTALSPYLFIHNAPAAMEFYKTVFGAQEIFRLNHANGKIMHAEMRIADSQIMLTDTDTPPQDNHPTHLFLYVPNADEVMARAESAGAAVIAPLNIENDGDRRGGFRDPFGFTWWIATNIKPMSRAELQQHLSSQ
jgi:PhnB protein